MRLLHLRRTLLHCVAGFGLLAWMAFAQGQSSFAKQIKSSACPNDDSALKLPPGFAPPCLPTLSATPGTSWCRQVD
jgi:hypothetical protein